MRDRRPIMPNAVLRRRRCRTMTIAPLNAVAGPRASRMPRTIIVRWMPRMLSIERRAESEVMLARERRGNDDGVGRERGEVTAANVALTIRA